MSVEPTFTLKASDPRSPVMLRTLASHWKMDIDCGARGEDQRSHVENLFKTADAMEDWYANRGVTDTYDAVRPIAILPALRNISKHVMASAIRAGYQPERLTDYDVTFRMNDPELLASLILVRNDIHGRNRAAGWWNDLKTGAPLQRDPRELAMLIVTEYAEAMEGFRKDAMDDKLPHRKMIEVELGDAIIREFDTAGGLKRDFLLSYFNLDRVQTGPLRVPSQLLELCCKADFESGHALPVGLTIAGTLFLGEALGLDVPGAIVEKIEFNANRADHKRENRLADGGKKL